MPVDDLTAQVAEVLARAASLFATPDDAAGANSRLADAAEAHRAVAVRSAELSGAMAAAQSDAVSATGKRIDLTAAAESRLAAILAEAAQLHLDGRSTAAGLRAVDVATLGPAATAPAGEHVALTMLRNRVTRMQALLAHHSAESARLADEIRGLGY
ncbi:MAG: hypothetical protein JO152_14825 [Mycobacteriaceae bacterium]|nr:hypothetical protein [Mycobacteriaceae bacterium]